MTDYDEIAGLERQLVAMLNQIAALNEEAQDLAERIIAEREQRQASATVHPLQSATRKADASRPAGP